MATDPATTDVSATDPGGAVSSPAPPTVTRHVTVLDTDDPRRLARFYCDLLGWEISEAEDQWVTIADATGPTMAFQLVLDHRRPTWPGKEVPQQAHIDFSITDLEGALAHAAAMGLERANTPVEGESFVVFVDPSGHPFCLCRG